MNTDTKINGYTVYSNRLISATDLVIDLLIKFIATNLNILIILQILVPLQTLYQTLHKDTKRIISKRYNLFLLNLTALENSGFTGKDILSYFRPFPYKNIVKYGTLF